MPSLVLGARRLLVTSVWGMAHGVGPGVVALVIAMNPVTTAVLARLVLGRRENSWGLVALALGTVGVVAACLPRLLADPSVGPGLITVLVALGGLSGGSLLQERKLRAVDPFVFTAIGVTVSVLPAAALALTTPQHLTDPVPAVALLLLLVLASAVGMVCHAACVRSRGARGPSILFAVIPAVSVIAAGGLPGASLDLTTAVGLACGALACAAQSRSARPTSGTPARGGRGGTGRAATVPERVR